MIEKNNETFTAREESLLAEILALKASLASDINPSSQRQLPLLKSESKVP